MRPIDGDEFLDKAICTRNYFEIKSIVDRMPTIVLPPNDPLTLKELWEMNGEPIWLPGWNRWVICYGLRKIGKHICMKTCFIGRYFYICINNYGKTWFAYRHRPEE